MKKIILLILSTLWLSCPWPFLGKDCQNTIEDCAQWVVHNIEYNTDKYNYDKDDYWATPKETEDKKSGDCEDICGLFMQMLEDRGWKSHMYKVENDTIIHAVVWVDSEKQIYDLRSSAKDVAKYSTFDEMEVKWTLKLTLSEYKECSEKYHKYHDGYGEFNPEYNN